MQSVQNVQIVQSKPREKPQGDQKREMSEQGPHRETRRPDAKPRFASGVDPNFLKMQQAEQQDPPSSAKVPAEALTTVATVPHREEEEPEAEKAPVNKTNGENGSSIASSKDPCFDPEDENFVEQVEWNLSQLFKEALNDLVHIGKRKRKYQKFEATERRALERLSEIDDVKKTVDVKVQSVKQELLKLQAELKSMQALLAKRDDEKHTLRDTIDVLQKKKQEYLDNLAVQFVSKFDKYKHQSILDE